jgi:hypothetical protein
VKKRTPKKKAAAKRTVKKKAAKKATRKSRGRGVDSESQVLFDSKRRCCVCFCRNIDAEEKEGQVAHIDNDSANSDAENLVFLCSEHRSSLDLTDSLARAEVKRFRETLYNHLKEEERQAEIKKGRQMQLVATGQSSATRKRKNPFTGEMEDAPRPKTYLCPDGARPNQQNLSEALGFTVPAPFVDLVEWIYDQAAGDLDQCTKVFGEFVGLSSADGSARYDSTPCELFPFGVTGVDGDHYGYLVHAPEVQADDYPICHYCPVDSDGVIIVGFGTFDGITSIKSLWTSQPRGPGWMAASMQFRAKREKEMDVQKAISVPRGWRFQASSDGVGVLAPRSLFSPAKMITLDRYGPAEPYVKAAQKAIRQGHLATALYYLREGYWFNWTNQPLPFCELLCEVYDRLERTSLADVVRARLTKWSEEG